MENQAEQLLQALKGKTLDEVLTILSTGYADVVFSTSFGKEDQVITHGIYKNQHRVQIFTLDTGRLFEETYEVFQRTIQKYKLPIQTYYPDQAAAEKMVSQKGPYSFYDSVENRKECCRIRKIEPLKRALAGKQIWITGLRREQSENRADMDMVEWDSANQIIKVHPIFEWTEREVDEYTDQHHVPVNALHKKGFPSIGC